MKLAEASACKLYSRAGRDGGRARGGAALRRQRLHGRVPASSSSAATPRCCRSTAAPTRSRSRDRAQPALAIARAQLGGMSHESPTPFASQSAWSRFASSGQLSSGSGTRRSRRRSRAARGRHAVARAHDVRRAEAVRADRARPAKGGRRRAGSWPYRRGGRPEGRRGRDDQRHLAGALVGECEAAERPCDRSRRRSRRRSAAGP